MSTTIERVIPLVGHLPASLREALGRRLRELMGFALIGVAGVAAAAMMTWSVQDPSLSHATSRAIRNIVGYPGAIGADLLMQILGLGAIMIILTVAVWGWRMMTHRHFDREALRLTCWLLCTVFASGFASCWQHGGSWPLPTGVGGVVGDALFRAPAVVFGPVGFIYRTVLGTIFCTLMAVTFVIACGYGAKAKEDFPEIEDIDDEPFEDIDEEKDRRSFAVSLGWFVHGVMSTKARIGRVLSFLYSKFVTSSSESRSAAYERQEPNLGGRRASPPIAPHDEHEDEEHEDEEEHEEEEEEIEEEPAPKARKKPSAKEPVRKNNNGKFELPSVGMLTAPKAANPEEHQCECHWHGGSERRSCLRGIELIVALASK